MTNYEKYKDQIDWQARAGASLAVRKSDNTPATCQEITCDECIFQKNRICELPAIEWLKAEYAEPKSEWEHDHEILKAYSDGANGVLEEIRAEIAEEKEHAYADFEQYKVEYLGQDGEDVLDSLPQDDFRYGMERCIDIIDKYKAESEV